MGPFGPIILTLSQPMYLRSSSKIKLNVPSEWWVVDDPMLMPIPRLTDDACALIAEYLEITQFNEFNTNEIVNARFNVTGSTRYFLIFDTEEDRVAFKLRFAEMDFSNPNSFWVARKYMK